MAKRRRDAKREAAWRELVARQGASGLSVRAFCRREGVAESNFYAWRRELRLRDREADDARARPTPMAFVPAVVASDSCGETSIAVELSSGCVLRLSGSTAIEQLADLVIALKQRGPQ